MSSRTLEQWIAQYNKKIPEGFRRDERFALFYLPDKGFAEIMDEGHMIVINQLCGELKFWRTFAEKLARLRGYTHAGTVCIRPIRPYIRLAGFEIERVEQTSGGERFYARDKRTGQKAILAPAGKATYFVTWEVDR